ncbi:hypothetical protein PHLCEN_2v9099 [Hermanssonia centrifuga]|uniref:Retrovirus-related Pol polyprotein from transposon TNT 1-94-like beta-barrel domain-containing protein n=1 Tax=Hermanssonia centrifuga TaxID=98765 RepID=A0A2R6NSJ1_9APHY|nr:hypothetical protein PHLCEN_2v9099 [Hermanssonia centrifuga]
MADTKVHAEDGRTYTEIWNSGATAHISPYRWMFDSFEEHTETIYIADNSTIQVVGHGTMVICVPYKNGWRKIHLLNVLYSPSFRCTLVSISRFVSKGFNILIDAEGLHLHALDNTYLASIPCRNGLYRIDHTAPDSAITPMAFLIKRNKVPLYDAHIRNGHVSYEYIKKALDSDHKYLGLQIDPSKMEEPLCEACVKGKISCAPIRKEHISNRAVNFGDILHMDLWGPSPVCAPGGLQYTFTILDEATGWLYEPKMCTKDKAFG